MTQNFLGPGTQGPDFKRIFVSVLLMTGVLLSINYFFPPQISQQATGESAQQGPASQAQQEVFKVRPKTIERAAQKPKAPEEFLSFKIDIKTPAGQDESKVVRGGYDVKVSTYGAFISRYTLNGYKNEINLAGGTPYSKLFLLRSRSNDLTLFDTSDYEIVTKDPNHLVLRRVTPEGVEITRDYVFHDKEFIIEHKIRVKNNSSAPRKLELDLSFRGSEPANKKSGFFTQADETLTTVCKATTKRETFSTDDLEKNNIKRASGKVQYAALDQRYFLAALVPIGDSHTSACVASFAGKADSADGEYSQVQLTIEHEPTILSSGESIEYAYEAYLGPKQLNLLKGAGHGLEENINFGWFGVISRPMLWLLTKIFSMVGNFGIAIILLTLLIKLLTFPLTQKSFVSMQNMKRYGPDLKVLQKKFGHDRNTLAQKQMEFYKEKGINPLAGCLPMLIQMPIWFALYQMLWNSVELYQQPFAFWIQDLTSPDPFFVLPVVMGVSMLIQTFFQPTPEDQPQMKYIMWGMPIFLTFIMINMAAGLSLYIFTNNILTLAQQIYIKRRYGSAKVGATA